MDNAHDFSNAAQEMWREAYSKGRCSMIGEIEQAKREVAEEIFKFFDCGQIDEDDECYEEYISLRKKYLTEEPGEEYEK